MGAHQRAGYVVAAARTDGGLGQAASHAGRDNEGGERGAAAGTAGRSPRYLTKTPSFRRIPKLMIANVRSKWRSTLAPRQRPRGRLGLRRRSGRPAHRIEEERPDEQETECEPRGFHGPSQPASECVDTQDYAQQTAEER